MEKYNKYYYYYFIFQTVEASVMLPKFILIFDKMSNYEFFPSHIFIQNYLSELN